MKPIQSLKTIVAAGIIGITSAIATPVNFNQAELTTDAGNDNRVRFTTVHSLDLEDGLQIHYHGLHEMQLNNTNTYNGINFASVGTSNARFGSRFITDKNGIKNGGFGIRNESLINKIADYGYVEATTTGTTSNIRFFAGYVLGKGKTLEIFTSQNFGQGKPSNWTEIQIYQDLTKNLAISARLEINNGQKVTPIASLLYKF